MKARIKQYEIQSLDDSALLEVVRFLSRFPCEAGPESLIGPVVDVNCPKIERSLRWFLLENPAARDSQHFGFCVRDKAGEIRGLNLRFPAVFLAGDRRILGLGGGGLFVEPEFQTLGFFLFRKKLSLRGYSFFFATTCNSKSAPLWQARGGCAVPNSNVELVFPLKLDNLLIELAIRKKLSVTCERIGGSLGRWANPILHTLERQAMELTVEPCRDWQKLSALFYRHRSKRWVTSERSPEYLEWRYGRNSDGKPSGVYLVHDRCGNEGWFSLGNSTRGRRGEIRGVTLLDAVWPREHMSPGKFFSAVVRHVDDKADAIFLRPRPEYDYRECSPWIVRRKWAVPTSFVITRNRVDLEGAASLDLVPADGDTALPISPAVCGATRLA